MHENLKKRFVFINNSPNSFTSTGNNPLTDLYKDYSSIQESLLLLEFSKHIHT